MLLEDLLDFLENLVGLDLGVDVVVLIELAVVLDNFLGFVLVGH